MKSEKIQTYQTILEHFKCLQVDIDYSRFLTGKSDCTTIIEDKQSFIDWSKQVETIIATIHSVSLTLHEAVNNDNDYEKPLDALETAVDELINLHTEITASCAHESGLMEGRYLIEHATGQYLDQISLHINEFRYQLNQLLFNCEESPPTLPNLLLTITEEIEISAFNDWLSNN